MTEAEVKNIIAKGESNTVTFFKSVPSAEKLADQIVTFSNTKGGIIIIGVDKLRRGYNISSGAISTCLNAALSMISGNPIVKREVVKVNNARLQVIIVTKPIPSPIQVIGHHKNVMGRRPRKVSLFKNEDTKSTEEDSQEIPEHSGESNTHIQDNESITPEDSSSAEKIQIREYRNTKIEKELSDKDLAPCFGVDTLVAAFFNLLRQTSTDGENVCFLGVFGKWGRGKSFFLNRLKKIASGSEHSNSFEFVTFNAWKYQKTPEIWASLIHTLIQHKSWWGRVCFGISWSVIFSFIGSFLFLCIAGACIWLTVRDWNSETDKSILTVIASGVSLFLSVFGFIQSFGLMDRQRGRRYRASDLMGVQFLTENELVRIIRRWNWSINPKHWGRWGEKYRTNRKVVLLVEDIDRCEDEAMLSIIEALKLIMENPEVAKRMIVVTSVDQDRLIQAYQAKCSYNDDINKKRFAIEQLNKIFLMGINLPSITDDDMEGYIAALGNRMLTDCKISSYDDLLREFNFDVTEDFGIPDVSLLMPDSPSERGHSDAEDIRIEQIVKNNDFDASIRLLAGILMYEYRYKSVRVWTPRQIRIIFYRLILANNLMHDFGLTLSEHLYRVIISGCTSNPSLKPESEEVKILEICNPYPVVPPIKEAFLTE